MNSIVSSGLWIVKPLDEIRLLEQKYRQRFLHLVIRMEVDDDSYIVDLSLSSSSRRPDSSGSTNSNKRSPSPSMGQHNKTKRSLRPRTEIKNYVETTDIVVVSDNEEFKPNGYVNGYDYSDSDDGAELPPLPPVKELSPTERMETEKKIKLLKDELRNEEMKLVLLKKLRQSQQMKENISVLPVNNNSSVSQPPVPSSHQLASKLASPNSAHRSPSAHQSSKPSSTSPNVTPVLQGQLMPSGRSSVRGPPPLSPVVNNQQSSRSVAPGMPASMYPVNSISTHRSNSSTTSHMNSGHLLSNNANMVNNSSSGRSSVLPNAANTSSNSYQNSISIQDRIKDVPQSTVISSASGSSSPFSLTTTGSTQQIKDRRNEDAQTPAQRQAAAKLALRKQLEKTLLQIPPPKPPPPEMHFIPNPSNTEFIYLLGLEHVVDYITKEQKTPSPPEPFQCSQCNTSFTPIWKWEKNAGKGKESKVICEACVTSNVKKALKAEHTNRLKTAFVKALQQEQEIEQRLAQASPQPMESPVNQQPPPPLQPSHQSSQSLVNNHQPSMSVSTPNTSSLMHNSITNPAPPPPPPPPTPKSSSHSSHSSSSRHNPTPPIPQPSPTPPREHHLAKLASETNKFNPHHAAAALHQQLLRGLPQHQPLPAHMIPFSPLLYPYQLAMVQAANSKSSVAAASLAELQRQAADLQRQYLLDMIPTGSPNSRQHSHSINNWKSS